jgi:hypothetical protein
MSRRIEKRRRARPSLELLEDRLAPSVSAVGPTVDVSRERGAQSEVGIAVNPLNPLNLVTVSNDLRDLKRLNTYNSFDGGLTWTTHAITRAIDGLSVGFRFDPNVAFDSDGNVYVVYSTGGGDLASQLVVACSKDGGNTFDQTAVIAAEDEDTVLHTASITTRANPSGPDAVLVVWAFVCDDGETIRAALSIDAGAHFDVTNDQVNDAAPERTFLPWAAVDGAGDFHVIWEVDQNDSGTGVILHDVLDGATLADGADAVVTTIQITDFGAPTSAIPAQPDRGIFSVGTIDIDRSGGSHDGRVYVSYADRADVNTDDTNVFVRYSDAGGAAGSWSDPVRLNDDATTTSQFLPRLAVDQLQGDVYVSWYDARNDPVNNQRVDVYLTSSPDGGQSWTANQRVTEHSSDESKADPGFGKGPDEEEGDNPKRDGNNYGEYAGLAVYGGIAHPAWTDARKANFDQGLSEEVYSTSAVVTLTGNAEGNFFEMSLDPTGTFLQFQTDFAPLKAAVARVVVEGKSGRDGLDIVFDNGDPTPARGVSFHGGKGRNTLMVGTRFPGLAGPRHVWKISGHDSGTVDGNIRFTRAASLVGGSTEDVFRFLPGGAVSGTIDGGAFDPSSHNWLDYSALHTSVVVDLSPQSDTAGQSATGVGVLLDIQNVIGSAVGGDVLRGSDASSVLVCHGGGNQLSASKWGRGVLIGGFGSNRLNGNFQEDLLIDGATIYDDDIASLDAIFAAWFNGKTYDEHVEDLRTGSGPADGRRLILGETVFSPRSTSWGVAGPSRLSGGASLDWYFTADPSRIVRRIGGERLN